jgi:hypothetical protein
MVPGRDPETCKHSLLIPTKQTINNWINMNGINNWINMNGINMNWINMASSRTPAARPAALRVVIPRLAAAAIPRWARLWVREYRRYRSRFIGALNIRNVSRCGWGLRRQTFSPIRTMEVPNLSVVMRHLAPSVVYRLPSVRGRVRPNSGDSSPSDDEVL